MFKLKFKFIIKKIYFTFKKLVLFFVSPIYLKLKTYDKIYSVSIIIPTYKPNPFIEIAVASIVNQKKINTEDLEIIIIVNGSNFEYYKKLLDLYRLTKGIKVYYTNQLGASVARNIGLEKVTKNNFLFLDDDDYLEPYFLHNNFKFLNNDIDVICCALIDFNKNSYNYNTYINSELIKNAFCKTKNIVKVGSLFSTVTAKIYSSSLLTRFEKFHEDFHHSEDIIYWIDNIGKINKNIVCSSIFKNSSYVRRITKNSLSRPAKKEEFSFYIFDRIKIIEYISAKMLSRYKNDNIHKFYENKLNSQISFIKQYYNKVDNKTKKRIEEVIYNSDSFVLKDNFK